MQLRIPREILERLKGLVASWRKRKGCRKRELQSLAGHISHACKVVRLERRSLWFTISTAEGPHDKVEC